MNDKTFMGVLAVMAVAIVGAIIFFGGESASTAWIGDPLEISTGEASGELDESGQPVAVQPADLVFGSIDAPVTLIEFGDFECPACGAFFPELKQLEAAYGDQLRVVFRHNPLTSLHPNAFAAHRAAQAAANQDKFWEMHDLMYQRQATWSRQQSGLDTSQAADVFLSMAQELELDIDQFQADIDSEEVFSYINSHLDAGSQLNVTGTPTLFLNGEQIETRGAAELSVLIDDILANIGEPAVDEADSSSSTQ